MSETTIHRLYKGEIEISFRVNPYHVYTLAGKRLISVTSITGQLDKSGPLKYWAANLTRDYVLDFLENKQEGEITVESLTPILFEASKQHTLFSAKAASIGDLVHDFAQRFTEYKLGVGPLPSLEGLPDEAIKGVNAFIDWFDSVHLESGRTERVVYSKSIGYVGKTDYVGNINGIPMILDYKTGNSIYLEHLLQLSLYWFAVGEEEGELAPKQGLIIRFDKETGKFYEHPVSFNLYQKALSPALALAHVKMILEDPEIKQFITVSK